MINKEQKEKMNNVIIDLKLKLDRANCNLSTLLDLNNIPETNKKIVDHKITLITPEEHKKLNDLAIEYINYINSVIVRVHTKLNEKEDKDVDITNEKTN